MTVDPDDISSNPSHNATFGQIVQARLSRRAAIRGGTLLAAAIAWNEPLHAFRAAVGGSGQAGAPLAASSRAIWPTPTARPHGPSAPPHRACASA